MAHHPRWKDLIIGIVATAAVAAGALAILVFGRVGTLHGKTFKLYVTISAARGVISGTDVWLDGQKVGLVKSVDFRPPTTGPNERLVLSLEVLDDSRSHIRRDTRVQVRAGGTLIGDMVVYMTSGTAKAATVANGDTIRAGEQADFESATAQFAEASRDFPGIIENVKLLNAQLQSAQSTLGAFGIDHHGADMERLNKQTSRLMKRMSSGTGTVHMAMGASDLLQARVTRAKAQADSIRSLLGSDRHSLGRFRRDSTLLRQVTSVRAEMDRVQRLAASPDGTLGRLRTDSAIVHAIHRDLVSLDSLIANIKKHPLRYIAF